MVRRPSHVPEEVTAYYILDGQTEPVTVWIDPDNWPEEEAWAILHPKEKHETVDDIVRRSWCKCPTCHGAKHGCETCEEQGWVESNIHPEAHFLRYRVKGLRRGSGGMGLGDGQSMNR